jgi:hypothetical protein
MWSQLLIIFAAVAAMHAGGGLLPAGAVAASTNAIKVVGVVADDVTPPTTTTTTIASVVEPLMQDMRDRFSATPLVRHLRAIQEGDDAATLKSFLPYITFFVNSFSDLNRMVLPYQDPQGDELKLAINEHCVEDSTHMLLLWQDLQAYDATLTEADIGGQFSSSVAFLWSDALYHTRRLGYQVARLVGRVEDQDPLVRYAMIRVMEEVGNVFFTTGVGYTLPNGTPSRYMSHDHLDLENGHLQKDNGETDTDHNEHEDDEHEHGHHNDGLNALFDERYFRNDEEREFVVSVMQETYQLFEDMLLAVYQGMETSKIEMKTTNDDPNTVRVAAVAAA